MKLVDDLSQFADQTSIHGIRYIAKSSSSKKVRISWFLIFTSALIYASLQIANEVNNWKATPTITIVETLAEPIDKVEFPAVTICPQSFNSDRWGPTIKILDYLQPCSIHGTCNDYQDFYDNFSEEVDESTYSEAINLIKTFYPSCKGFRAWNPTFVEEYQNCTNKIIEESTPAIKENTDVVKLFALNIFRGRSIKIEFDKIMKDIDIENDFKTNIRVAIAHFEKVSLPSTLSCFEINRCLEIVREVILRLKLIEWGGLGHKVSNAGPYFGDMDGNEWPHSPLHKDPTALAKDFNQLLTKLTYEMSNGILKNVSLLDLPAFGSTIGTLKKDLKRQFIWPTKVNFELFKANPGVNRTRVFESYKSLTDDWLNYMEQLDKIHHQNYFTPEMKNNKFFNFTQYVKDDMKTFLTAVSGSFHSAMKHSLSTWKETAKKVFGIIKEDQKRGVYDKVIMDCAFKEDLRLRKIYANDNGGCKGFHPSLTTNGMCYTFNGKETSELWQPSEMFTTFANLFPASSQANRTFGGQRTVQGLQFWVNLKPYTNQRYGPTTLAYRIGVTKQNAHFDQKISTHKLRPGYHTTIQVIPKILETSLDFESLDVETRKCKLSHETTGFQFFKEYTRKGCETECAAKKASLYCQCLPWSYPNNFTIFPMCDMFGGFCFDEIMSNEYHYKDCQSECMVDCKEISLSTWESTVPLNIEDLCKSSYFESFFKQNFESLFALENYQQLMQGQPISDLSTALANGSLCLTYLEKYVSLVTIESPTKSITKSMNDISRRFIDKLAIVGSLLAIYLGKNYSIIQRSCSKDPL